METKPPVLAPAPEGQRALLPGPADLVEGYYALEELERSATSDALDQHPDLVALWYRALTLYRRGVLGTWQYTEQPPDELAAWGLRMDLVGLGVSSAKAGLDMLLAGYYSMAYAAVRHMIESALQIQYLAGFPEEWPLWYGQPGARAKAELVRNPHATPRLEPPGCTGMVKRLKELLSSPVPFAVSLLDRTYNAWKLMCKGAHPSAEGLTQTRGPVEGDSVLGATYNRHLCLVGFDNGFWALQLLLVTLRTMKPQSEEWKADLLLLIADVSSWRDSMRGGPDDPATAREAVGDDEDETAPAGDE